jgi:hypothetical protein
MIEKQYKRDNEWVRRRSLEEMGHRTAVYRTAFEIGSTYTCLAPQGNFQSVSVEVAGLGGQSSVPSLLQ